MAQQATRYCQQCGSPVGMEQRFCSNCGATMDSGAGKSTERAQDGGIANDETRLAAPPPPPMYPQGGMSYGPSPVQQGYQGSGMNYAPPVGNVGVEQPPIPRRSAWGTTGCVLIAIIVVIVAICGGGGYFAYTKLKGAVDSASSSTTVNGNQVNSSTATAAAVVKTTTFPTNPPQSVDYADVIITLLDAKQSTSFADDSGDGSGLLRLDMRLQNTYKGSVSVNNMSIVLPDGTVADKSDALDDLYPEGNTTKTTWVDFGVPTSTDVSKLVLRIGASDEEQVNIPLTGHADLSQYQAKSASPNVKTPYAHMNWTVTTVKAQGSYQGVQAKQGKMYVYVSFSIDNTSSDTFSQYYGDYLRLKSGTTTSPPEIADSFPVSIAAGQTNVQATCAFAMPKGSSAFTLIFQADPGGSYPQETVNFQIK
jgi:hypothetical protein